MYDEAVAMQREVLAVKHVRTSFVARVSHEAISEVEPLSTDI